jgi:hypothetical protein
MKKYIHQKKSPMQKWEFPHDYGPYINLISDLYFRGVQPLNGKDLEAKEQQWKRFVLSFHQLGTTQNRTDNFLLYPHIFNKSILTLWWSWTVQGNKQILDCWNLLTWPFIGKLLRSTFWCYTITFLIQPFLGKKCAFSEFASTNLSP